MHKVADRVCGTCIFELKVDKPDCFELYAELVNRGEAENV